MTSADPRPAESILRRLIELIDAQDWDGLRTVLAPDVTVTFAHTGEQFDRDGYIALNRDYPGRWFLEAQRVVADDRSGAAHALVFNADRSEVHHVGSFASVADGLITELTELWVELTEPDPERRPASGLS
ncbi:hypothetical protein N802_03910 [Knoellia sinensis KCTC 19936]|uniref:SnoaL-like domain-containing protein n=1 Tax=Knoellia sinensis KCTC 19936 TaxID=1385520 RepID=A0A0A0J303_9MICO|nr:nuclear transport factor 2 family protein [Knoellia sinensis]KGN31523.1 hypothetical protein N802_03910 [Knoellia sinensis KCTC 19936]